MQKKKRVCVIRLFLKTCFFRMLAFSGHELFKVGSTRHMRELPFSSRALSKRQKEKQTRPFKLTLSIKHRYYHLMTIPPRPPIGHRYYHLKTLPPPAPIGHRHYHLMTLPPPPPAGHRYYHLMPLPVSYTHLTLPTICSV